MTLQKNSVAKLPESNTRNDGFLSRLVLSWVYEIIGMGRKGQLKPENLKMPGAQATEVATAKFDENWQKELDEQKKGGKPNLIRALWRSFGSEFIAAGVCKLLWSFFVLMAAFYFVRSLVQYVEDPVTKPNVWNSNPIPSKGVGWILSASFFIDSLLVGIALQRMGDISVRLGIKIRAALMTAVYRKSFKIANLHTEDSDGGNVVSMVATDCAKLYEGVQHCQNVWTAPLEAGAIIGLLLSLTGVYGLPALGVVLIVLPLQYYFGYKIASYKMQSVQVADTRVLRMHEILLAIKLVKFYVWEKSFAKQVEDVRKEEMRLITRAAVIKTLNLCLVFAVPPLIALVIFAAYAFNTGKLDASLSFVVLSLFNTLRFPLVVLPKALRGASEASAAVKRLQAFLLCPETEETKRSPITEADMDDAVLNHPAAPADFKLRVPKFSVKAGEVVAVVGRVGSGKSSVLQAILGSMAVESGSMRVGGTVAYVPQTPWVQNLSLRNNILFGLPMDEKTYKAVIHACALELDLQILPNGDASMAGERGINLSGGQRQRVCLARAAYHDCDMVLLDNPLSAVDQHTSKHIFDHCIKGLLKDKAVVLIAHQLELLPQCDKVAIMKDGVMVYFGPYNPDALNQHMPVDHMLYATVEASESAVKPTDGDSQDTTDGKEPRRSSGETRRSMQRQDSKAMPNVDSVQTAMNEMDKQEARQASAGGGHGHDDNHGHGGSESPKIAALHPAEDELKETPEHVAAQFSGIVTRLPAGPATKVYWAAGGRLLGLFSLLVFMTTQTCRIMSDLWIRQWSSDLYGLYATQSQYDATKTYILAYMGFVIGFILLLLSRDSVFSWWSKKAATNLHNSLFKRVLGAPILFFLRTPLGDVLNSFAKDQDTIDEALPDTLHMTTIYLMILLTSLAIVTVSIYYYAIMTAALFLAFFMMQTLYLPAATTLKRWAGDSAAAVFVHVDESLHGMDVIRAFDAVGYFIQENVQRINVHHLALFNTEQTHLWLAFWCDFFGAILVVATCLFSVAFKETLGSANVGLAISNTIQVLVFFTWVVRGVAETVSMWDAVERITSFATNVPVESDREEDSSLALLPAVPANANGSAKAAGTSGLELVAIKTEGTPVDMATWPKKGDLRFDDVSLRYFPGAPLALKHVSFHIQDCEKVGVVGRTGSGKTTLLMGLFRMFGLAGGRILIDGVDVATLPLEEVRKRIAIIPQEPVMFKGTVRSNLDPFGEASDADLWEALALVSLKAAIQEMGGLDTAVQEGGGNFSLGMKQLVCMARCVLKKTRLLVLDEATAAMDLQTDSLIQKTIRKVFKDRTTITIAHRLDTIIFSDKILAMASGRLKEFDAPNTLLRNPNSMFNMLVEDTGPHASLTLRNMAEKGPQDDGDDDDEAAAAPADSLASPSDTVSSSAVLLEQPGGQAQA